MWIESLVAICVTPTGQFGSIPFQWSSESYTSITWVVFLSSEALLQGINESSGFVDFPSSGISMKHLHGVSRGEQLLTITTATDSLNALKSLQPGSGLSPWLWYVQIFTINVDKYLDGLLSKLMDDAKMVSTMNMIMRESGHKKSRIWDKYNTVKF